MHTSSITFRAPTQHKDSLEFLAKNKKTSVSQIIIDIFDEILEEKKRELVIEKYYIEQAEKILQKYEKDNIGFTLNDF